ncbi:MarR family winged helix-turn-helix transcriptional regulator [Streptacidiphilus jiangxiensis]|uniref:DNA-binding transcriptional regulator, MarR family n=1 Tax=Streptacidiphilus jiangxiensis TaxID=235985 RepID=A0A1H7U5D4_STRJI|nr:MarR family transcriptional regulator [Streptacidiphilus jiangxiensis]SEL91965.1 DNA-binding transcriptional regulator, MarR family [Streptacidiphilus jiangxiensis]
MTDDATPNALRARLGYLLKHAHHRFAEASTRALAPLGIDGRELAVLAVLGGGDRGEPLSQAEAATALGVDRTTMVALADALEAKGLVERRRSPTDRRRNALHVTEGGAALLLHAEAVRADVERGFLAPLVAAGEDPDALGRLLSVLLATAPSDDLG